MNEKLGYNELVSNLEDAPQTWVPGLLKTLVERAVRASVFVPGGLQRFVAQAEEDVK